MKICTVEIASDIAAAVRSRHKMVIVNLTIAKKKNEVKCICKLISQNHLYILIHILQLCHAFSSQICWLNKSKKSEHNENWSKLSLSLNQATRFPGNCGETVQPLIWISFFGFSFIDCNPLGTSQYAEGAAFLKGMARP